MKISYNAPVVLTFALVSTAVMMVDTLIPGFTKMFFAFHPTFDFGNPLDYFRLVSHAIGHGGWGHLFSNFAMILLIGPILEEKYGSRDLAIMMVVTAVVSSILAIILFNHAGLGASGIVFMMIILASFTNTKAGTIPLTFVLVGLLYLGSELFNALNDDNISQFAHILGGLVGGGFGYVLTSRHPRQTERTPA